jgi:hypothetical protein
MAQSPVFTIFNPNSSLLGGIVSSRQGPIYLIQERIVKLNLAIENLLTQEKASALIFYA